MQTFEVRILDRIGEALAGNLGLDTEMLDDWTTEGARYVLSKMPKDLWKFFAVEPAAFAPTTGITVESQKVIDVYRNDGTLDQPCRMIPWNLRGRATDSSEINYATATDPVWYIDPTTSGTPTLKILPVSGTAVGKVTYVNFPSIDASADSSITGFPDDLEDLVVDYALCQAKQREATYLRRLAHAEISGTRIEDALDKAKVLIDDLSATDFESYLTNEDVEMAGTTVSGAAQEINRANAEIQYAMVQAGDYLKSSGVALQDYIEMKKDLDNRLKDWIAVNLS